MTVENTLQISANHTDILAVWAKQMPTSSETLLLVKIDGNEQSLIPFTTACASVKLHFLDTEALRSYVHCTGSDCVLCRLGRKAEVRELLPMYSIAQRGVCVLPVSRAMRPGSLQPQLNPILQQMKDEGGRRIVIISRDLKQRFYVSQASLPDDADDGAEVIRRFLDKYQQKQIDLTTIYPRYENSALAEIREIKDELRARGIKV